jgi:hypothetical protein
MTTANETFESNSNNKKDKAKSDAKSSDVVKTGQPAKKPGNKTADKPGNKTADKPGNKTADKPGNKTADKPGNKTADKLDYSKGLSNLNIQYHDSPEKIAKDEGINLETVSIRVYDPNEQKIITIKRPAIQNSATYYEPGKYKYGGAKYVPNYTESVLLSASNHFFTGKPTASPKFSFYDINAADSGVSKYTPGT